MAETWVINEEPNRPSEDISEAINFNSNNTDFNEISISRSGPRATVIFYDNVGVANTDGGMTWLDQAYRTITFDTVPTGDLLTWLQANAVKQVTGYSVTYHANGGMPIPSDLTGQTNLPSSLPTVSKYGYRFDGWYTDSTFTTPAVAGATIEANTDLYAKFTAVYSITYHTNGGLPVPEDLTSQTNLPSTLPTIAKEEYTFDGWYLNSTFTTPAVAGAEISADTDLYAKFTALEQFVYKPFSPRGLPYKELVNDGESQPYYYVRELPTGVYIVKGGSVQLYAEAQFSSTPLTVPEGMIVYVKYEEGTFTITTMIYDTFYTFDDTNSQWIEITPSQHQITNVTIGTDTIDITIS